MANLDTGEAASLFFLPFLDKSEHLVCMAEIESSGRRKTAGFVGKI